MPKIKVIDLRDEVNPTASSLMDAAERLFARDGIENVSIRQIVTASGHGNLSGAHYHFGGRETLIRKVLERRMVVVDAMRHEALDRLVQQGRDTELFAVIEKNRARPRVGHTEFPLGQGLHLGDCTGAVQPESPLARHHQHGLAFWTAKDQQSSLSTFATFACKML